MITQERYEKLLKLKGFIDNSSEQLQLAKELEPYFTGEVTGCSCKYSQVRSKLNRFWETIGINEYNEYLEQNKA